MTENENGKARKKAGPKQKKTAKERVTAVKERVEKELAEVKINKRVKPAPANTITQNRLKLLITIVGRNKAEFYTDLIQSFEVNMQLIALAQGTASEKMLGLLGLTENEKAVIIGVIQEKKIPDALHTLESKFTTIKDGNGIAFTVPLTSVIGTLIYGFLSNNRLTVKEVKQ